MNDEEMTYEELSHKHDMTYEFIIEIRRLLYKLCVESDSHKLIEIYQEMINYLIETDERIEEDKVGCAHDLVEFSAIGTTLLTLKKLMIEKVIT